MQIDVLSQNTLKLTLSRLDMFDLDIKYESLSGKNPDTKRLLSHVLRTVRLDKSAGLDFSGERLFVEAFPRPDGGCMLYISCLAEDGKGNIEKKTMRLTAKKPAISERTPIKLQNEEARFQNRPEDGLLCRFNSVKELEGACKSLSWQLTNGSPGLEMESSLYGNNRCGGNNPSNNGEYRLLIHSNNNKLISAIVSEYGELLTPEHELPFTCEHYNLIAPENAVEKMNHLL